MGFPQERLRWARAGPALSPGRDLGSAGHPGAVRGAGDEFGAVPLPGGISLCSPCRVIPSGVARWGGFGGNDGISPGAAAAPLTPPNPGHACSEPRACLFSPWHSPGLCSSIPPVPALGLGIPGWDVSERAGVLALSFSPVFSPAGRGSGPWSPVPALRG